MHTIGQRLCFLALRHLSYALCHGAVGEQHELLYEFVSVFRLLIECPCGFAFLINIEVKFLAVEFHCSVLEAFLAQFLCQCVKDKQSTCKLRRHVCVTAVHRLVGLCLLKVFHMNRCWLASAILHAVLFQNVLHLLVGEAVVTLYHGVYQSP